MCAFARVFALANQRLRPNTKLTGPPGRFLRAGGCHRQILNRFRKKWFEFLFPCGLNVIIFLGPFLIGETRISHDPC
jgi:hypothetical protein